MTEPGDMRPETPEGQGRLRTGLTTGVCATAGAVGAARLLLGGTRVDEVSVTLPRGQTVSVALETLEGVGEDAEAAVIKDAGDDPDATHGARIRTRVSANRASDIVFRAGPGVGTVTRTGLPVAVGEPAINPVPRRMIAEHLTEAAAACGYDGGWTVTVAVDGGERIAQRTMNPRLGIEGGISILGTTGIVRPFSCAAYIASIHQAIDVARANGLERIACCTGGTSEEYARSHYGLPDMALVEMGDLFGAVLKYLRRHPVPGVAMVAGFGKLSKFAAGHPDTHSRKCGIDWAFLARKAAEAGAGDALCDQITAANTSIEALEACRRAGIPLGDRIAATAADKARRYLPPETSLEVCAVDRNGERVGFASGEAA